MDFKEYDGWTLNYKGVKLVNIKGDITDELGMITNAANENLWHGGGVAGAISRAGGK